MSIGQLSSASQNALMIRFIGGPYDGQHGLYDHAEFASISFSNMDEMKTHIYLPSAEYGVYLFSETQKWRQPPKRKPAFELSI